MAICQTTHQEDRNEPNTWGVLDFRNTLLATTLP
jgi:hypothetical protein